MATIQDTYRPLLEAIASAARAHQGALRKDGRTPYVSHVFRVCLIVRDVFNMSDPEVLMAAVLHDTVEDTTTDFDDLERQFGANVARWVAALSKDKRLPEPEREDAYCRQLAQSPWQIQVCKLADVFDNLLDSTHANPRQQPRVFQNAHRYLEALKSNLTSEAQEAWNLVASLLAELVAEAGSAEDP